MTTMTSMIKDDSPLINEFSKSRNFIDILKSNMKREDSTGIQQGCSLISEVLLEGEPIDLSIKRVYHQNSNAEICLNEEPIDLTMIKKDEEQCIECAALSGNDEPQDCLPCRYKKVERVKRALTFDDDDYPKKIRKIGFATTKCCDLKQKEDTTSYGDKANNITPVEEGRVDDKIVKENVKNIVQPFYLSPSTNARMGFTDESEHHTFMNNITEGPVIKYMNSSSRTDTALMLDSDESPINCSFKNYHHEDVDKYSTEIVHIVIDGNSNSKYLYGSEEEGEEETDPLLSNPYISLNLLQNKLLYKGKVVEGIDVTVSRVEDSCKDDTFDSLMDPVQLAKDYMIKKLVKDYFDSNELGPEQNEELRPSPPLPEDAANSNLGVNLKVTCKTSKISSTTIPNGPGVDCDNTSRGTSYPFSTTHSS